SGASTTSIPEVYAAAIASLGEHGLHRQVVQGLIENGGEAGANRIALRQSIAVLLHGQVAGDGLFDESIENGWPVALAVEQRQQPQIEVAEFDEFVAAIGGPGSAESDPFARRRRRPRLLPRLPRHWYGNRAQLDEIG